MSAPMQPDKIDTISADDQVRVHSVEGSEMIETVLTIDTVDQVISTRLAPRDAEKLGQALIAHASGAKAARHTTGCYVETVNNAKADTFWVCHGACPTRQPVAR